MSNKANAKSSFDNNDLSVNNWHPEEGSPAKAFLAALRFEAFTALNYAKHQINELNSLKIKSEKDISYISAEYEKALTEFEGAIERTFSNVKEYPAYERYIEHLLKLRSMCDVVLEEKIIAYGAGRKRILERTELIQGITRMFKDTVEAKALDYPGRIKLLADIYDALESETDQRPKAPPENQLYAKRPNLSENAPAFIERVYGKWLTGEFTRADLRRLDDKAEMALRNWERANGKASFNLPTLQEKNDALVRELDLYGSPPAKEAHRLRGLALSRKSSTQS